MDRPEWWPALIDEGKKLGVKQAEIDAFLGKPGNIPNIQAWLDEDKGREPRHLISAIADLRAAKQELEFSTALPVGVNREDR